MRAATVVQRRVPARQRSLECRRHRLPVKHDCHEARGPLSTEFSGNATQKMTTETLSRELDAHIVTLLTRISSLRETSGDLTERKAPMSIEARSLELWRAVAVECFATFLFSLVVSGAAASSAVSGSGLSVLATAVASGFAIAAISLIFGHISGKSLPSRIKGKRYFAIIFK